MAGLISTRPPTSVRLGIPSTAGTPPGDDKTSCGCKVPSMNTVPSPFLNDCNVLYGDPSNVAGNVAGNMCEAMACAAGIGVGLTKIPFRVTLASGGSITVSVKFSRKAYVWGIVFYQGRADFDRQQWTITNLNSSAQTQAWDVYGTGSTFATGGAQPFNPNTDALPLELFFEQGDNDLSNLIHHRNFLPPLVTNTNVGNGSNAINYTLALSAAAVADQVATGWHYVWFPGEET